MSANAPLHCPECGRFLSDSGSQGYARGGYEFGDVNWGTCKVHGPQEWRS